RAQGIFPWISRSSTSSPIPPSNNPSSPPPTPSNNTEVNTPTTPPASTPENITERIENTQNAENIKDLIFEHDNNADLDGIYNTMSDDHKLQTLKSGSYKPR
ncbi:MAG TPA: hypothetical protein PLW93_01575, partial [Candidatus Absconditabacterales bacterium]|nr:hypothetical protein [Candidatus Absconditabacterales bacterium]